MLIALCLGLSGFFQIRANAAAPPAPISTLGNIGYQGLTATAQLPVATPVATPIATPGTTGYQGLTATTQPSLAAGTTLTAQAVIGNTLTAQKQIPPAIVLPTPTGLEAQAGGDRILIAWYPVTTTVTTGVAYAIFRSPNEITAETALGLEPVNLAPVRDAFFLDMKGFSRTPPEPGQRYYYAVMTVDALGNTSPFSASVQVLNTAEITMPTSFIGEPLDQAVQLSWVPSFSGGPNGLDGYMLFRSRQAGQLGQPLFPDPLAATTYLDEGTPSNRLINDSAYYYTLMAQDKLGERSAPAGQITVSPFLAASAPLSLTATGKTDDMIQLRWAPAKAGTHGLTGYNIYRQSDVENEPVKINKQIRTAPDYVDSEQNSTSKPLLGRFYTYHVRAVDEQGNEGPASASAQAGPRVPIEIPATGLLSTSIPGLPPESSLTITGRKKIDISYTEVIPLNIEKNAQGEDVGTRDRYPSITSGLSKGFNLEQELQVRLQGKVGKKITVDVDYDDTQDEQRKISIIYAGDPGDVIQEAAFGDILLDLPRTEFAGYNKNLFGAKLKVALDNFRFQAIGAQTKGITVTEKFKGNSSSRTLDKQDVSFTAFKYYYLTKEWPGQVNHPELPNYDSAQPLHGIVPGSDKIYVTNGLITADSVTITAHGQVVRFNLLSPGYDYSVDYDRGIVTFTSTIAQTWMIAVAYRNIDSNGVEQSVGYDSSGNFDFDPSNLVMPSAGATSDAAHLIQDYNGSTNERFYSMMLMNRYSLGYQNIFDPQSDPDFVIKIFNTSGIEVPVPQPSDTLAAEQYYRIDPSFGTIRFAHNYPFQERLTDTEPAQGLSDTYDPLRKDAYSTQYNPSLTSGADASNAHKFTLHVEFKNLITFFQLAHWNVIKNSEIIKKDGLKLQRNTDYYIDYDTGYITFLNPESIASSTEITVTYEYLPFGGKFQSNLFGARAEYDLIEKKLSVGSTYLYSASQAPLDIPDIRSTPTSLSLFDVDAKLTMNPDDFGQWSLPLLGDFKIPLTIDVTAEAAYSIYETNTFRRAGEDGVAMIDGMEGSDNVLSLPPDNNAWFPSSNPGVITNLDDRKYIYMTDAFETGRVPVDDNDKSHQLRWYYSELSSATWDGFVYPISTSGTNLHDYRYLELSIYSAADAAHPVVLNFDIGLVSEDSNGNDQLNFEGDRQTLGSGRDVGIENYLADPYAVPPVIGTNPGGFQGEFPTAPPVGFPGPGVAEYWGANNGRLNNEDLDNDDQLDLAESYLEYEIVLQPGWRLYKIPLSDVTRALSAGGGTVPTINTQDPAFLSFVKHVRMWVTGQSNTPTASYIQFESIQLTGNKWQPTGIDSLGNQIEPAATTINATTISLETDSGYVPNKHFYIYDEDQEEEELQNERSLEIEYTLDNTAVVVTSLGATLPAYCLTRSLSSSSTGSDYTNYRSLRLDIYKKTATAPGEYFFLRLGLDENNFYQYRMPLDQAPVNAWHTFTVALDGSDGHRLEHFEPNSVAGLSRIKEISLGVFNPNPAGSPEILWVNNIRVTGGKTREGLAVRVSSSTRLSDILTISSDYRDVGSDFFTIDETPSGKQHVTTERVDATLTKISWLPASAAWNRTANYTEQRHRADPSYSNNFATPDVTTETISGHIAYNQLPGLDVSFNALRTRKTTEYIEQRYNVNYLDRTEEATPSISYSLPSRVFNLPLGNSTITGKFRYIDNYLEYDTEGAAKLKRADLINNSKKWKQTREETYTYQGTYNPVKYLRILPAFTYKQNSARGFLSGYKFYAALDPLVNTGNPHYFSDIYRMSRLEKIAKLTLNFLNIPVITPSATYTMTNTRDYISDTLSVPGSLSLQSGVALGDILGWNQFPRFNLSQNYTISATYRNEYGRDPVSDLEFKHLWMINPLDFRRTDERFDAAYINSKTLTNTMSTTIGLIPDVSLTPQASSAWTRRVNSGVSNITETLSLGSGLVWSRIPSLSWLNLQSLNLDYRYSENKSIDNNNVEINRNTTHTSTLTLPFRLWKELSSSLSGSSTNTIRLSGLNLGVKSYENLYTVGFNLAYNLNMNTPIKLPNFWPFNGAILRLQQTLRLSNNLKFEWARNEEKGTQGIGVNTDTVTNDTIINYSLWRNVEGDVSITNQWFFDDINSNKDYWAIRIKAGLTAIF